MESVLVKLAHIEVGENHRSRMDPKGLGDLAASIKAVGVLQPLIVRPLPQAGQAGKKWYELVAGHRRFKAAGMAGLDAVPCSSFPLADGDVVQVQLIENIQREDPHPLDEADAYRMLRDDLQIAVADIAARVGKSTAYVTQRLALSALVEPARSAFRKGELEAGAALVLARIADPKDQKAAAKTVLEYCRDGGAIGMAEAARVVRQEYMLDLAQAPFDPKDAGLVAAAGACAACPKRTGTNPDLFGDIKDKDLCSDSGCFHRKADAAWAARVAAHQAEGGVVMPEAQGKKLFPYGSDTLAHDSGMVDLDAVTYDFSSKGRTWRSLVGPGNQVAAAVTLARAPSGKVFELVTTAAVAAGLRAKGIKAPSRSIEGSSAQSRAARKKERQKAVEHRGTFDARLKAIVAKYARTGPIGKLFRILAVDLCVGGNHDALRDFAKARAVEVKKPKDGSGGVQDAMKAWALSTAEDGDLQELLLYVACYGYGASAYGGTNDTMKHAAKALGVDLSAVKPEKAPAAGKAKKPAAKRPRKRGSK